MTAPRNQTREQLLEATRSAIANVAAGHIQTGCDVLSYLAGWFGADEELAHTITELRSAIHEKGGR